MGIENNEISSKALGGTELMTKFIKDNIDPALLDKFQITPSRIRDLDETKLRIFYAHDLPHDPESAPLANGGYEKFHRLVFVSHWQQQLYINHFKLPWHKTVVLQNAINPIEISEKPTDKIRLIYHSTPHRGLNILVPVFEELLKTYPDKIHLDVYSSFKLYGWEDRDKHFESLFEKIKSNPNMTYHGTVSNEEIRIALAKSHIFAYPSIWPETSCICLMEAMSAGLICVHPNFGALPETAANLTYMYNWHEDQNIHVKIFYMYLKEAIDLALSKPGDDAKMGMAKTYADLFYGWGLRRIQWTQFLKSIEHEPVEMPKAPVFTYRTS